MLFRSRHLSTQQQKIKLGLVKVSLKNSLNSLFLTILYYLEF